MAEIIASYNNIKGGFVKGLIMLYDDTAKDLTVNKTEMYTSVISFISDAYRTVKENNFDFKTINIDIENRTATCSLIPRPSTSHIIGGGWQPLG